MDLSAYPTNLVSNVVAVEVAASTLDFVFIFELFPGFIVKFVNGGVDWCWWL